MLPERVEELCCCVSDLVQSALQCLSEGGVTALGVFDVLIQTVLQGGVHHLQTADRHIPVRDVSSVSQMITGDLFLPLAAFGR